MKILAWLFNALFSWRSPDYETWRHGPNPDWNAKRNGSDYW